MPSWLTKTDVPLFVSHRRLKRRISKYPKSWGPWALDSGGFTELSMFGEWTVPAKDYVEFVRRYSDEIGPPDFASPQDWMCEPWITAKTGLSVDQHLSLTVNNYLELKSIDDQIPFIPVLQGWSLDDYFKCLEMYDNAGVNVREVPTVGVGSVCRRQATSEIAEIIKSLHDEGVAIHGFGVKVAGLKKYGEYMKSSDSMAWSFGGRHREGCDPSHKTEANCLRYALNWRNKISGSN